jgi:YD repeat-containing protein
LVANSGSLCVAIQQTQIITPRTNATAVHGVSVLNFISPPVSGGYDENAVYYSTTGPVVLDLGWSTLINPGYGAGSNVKIGVTYRMKGVNPATEYYEVTLSAAAALQGASLSWSTTNTNNIGVESITGLVISQLNPSTGLWEQVYTSSNTVAASQIAVGPINGTTLSTDTDYNAFGEIVSKGINGGWQETFEYDNAGRLWRDKTPDGATRIKLSDMRGQVTAEITAANAGAANALATSADASVANAVTSTMRTETRYDLAGNVITRSAAARNTEGIAGANEGGATSSYVNFNIASVQSANFIALGTDENGTVTSWGVQGPNTVTLNWSNLSVLGPGPVRVRIDYLTSANANQGAVSRYQEWELASADSGATLSWYLPAGMLTPSQVPAQPYGYYSADYAGISQVTRVQVMKYSANNVATTVIDRSSSGVVGERINVPKTSDMVGTPQFQYRLSGATTWISTSLTEFADAWTFNASALGPGNYEYQVLYGTTDNPALTVKSSGVYRLGAPWLAVLADAPLFSDSTRPSTQYWTSTSLPSTERFRYRLVGSSIWYERPVYRSTVYPTKNYIQWDFASSGTYQYELLNNGTTAHATGTVTISSGSPRTYTNVNTTQANTTAISLTLATVGVVHVGTTTTDMARPTANYTYDRWGNMTSVSDWRSSTWLTTYRYNAGNKLIEESKPDSNGSQGVDASLSRFRYDKLGRQIATIDALGNINRFVFDAAGQLQHEIHADADALQSDLSATRGVVTNYYNAFGDKVRVSDALGNLTDYAYDKLSRLTQVYHAYTGAYAGITSNIYLNGFWKTRLISTTSLVLQAMLRPADVYEYDQNGRRTAVTNGDGETTRYVYDAAGNLIKTIKPMGQVIASAWDTQGRKIAEVDGNGYLATWTYNYFGQLSAHTDIGGARYAYTYNSAGKLLSQTNTRGQNLSFTYDDAGQLLQIVDAQLKSNGASLNQITTYKYDLAGNRIVEKLSQTDSNGAQVVYQDNRIAYDAQSRMRLVEGLGGLRLNYTYDKNGNRLRQWGRYINASVLAEHSYYFAYDNMNRQILVDGTAAAANTSSLSAQQGHLLSYDKNGNRISDTYMGNKVIVGGGQTVYVPGSYDENGVYIPPYSYDTAVTYTAASTKQLVTETYGYDGMDRLVSTMHDGRIVERRYYDKASRAIFVGTSDDAAASAYFQAAQLEDKRRFNLYNSNGILTQQVVQNRAGTHLSTTDYTAVDGMGNVRQYVTQVSAAGGGGIAYTNTYQASLVRMEGYREGVTSATSTYFQAGSTTNTYDKNGFLTQVTDATLAANNRSLINNAAGQIVQKLQGGLTQRTALFAGQQLAVYGDGMSSPLLSPTYESASSAAGAAFANSGVAGAPGSSSRVAGGGVRSYTVMAGDTLRSIAQGQYGSASLWWKIADANGLLGDSGLQVGQVLSVPIQAGGASNGAGDFRVYDASSIVGDTSPNMPAPPPKKNGCGFLGKLIMIVVAIVVTAGVGSYLGFQAGAGFTAGNVAAGAAGAAAGSIASQLVGMAIGEVDKFSWKSVALAAIGGGLSAGIPTTLEGFEKGSLTNTVARAMVQSALTQGIGVVTGLQDKFSWSGVAMAGLGAGVMQGVGEAFLGSGTENLPRFDDDGNLMPGAPSYDGGRFYASDAANSLGARFGSNAPKIAGALMAGVASGATVALAKGGRVSGAQIAADVFGNFIGGYFAQALGDSGSQQEEKLKREELAQIKRDAANNSSQAPWARGGINVLADNEGSAGISFEPDMDQDTADDLRRSMGGWVADPDDTVLLADAGGNKLELSNVRKNTSKDDEIAAGRRILDTTGRFKELQRNIDELGAIAAGQSPAQLLRDLELREAAQATSDLYKSGAGDVRGPFYSPAPSGGYGGGSPELGLPDVITGPSIGNSTAISGTGTIDDPRVLPPVVVTAPRMTQAEMDEFDLLNPGLIGGAGVGMGVPEFRLATPVPSTPVLPINNGYWTNPLRPGNSGWVSSSPNVIAITGGKPVQFRNGMVNFSPWSQGSFVVPNMTGRMKGIGNDLELGRKLLQERYSLPNDASAQKWLQERKLTLHHAADGVRLELIPSDLHNTARGGVHHAGGASILRNWDYSKGTPMEFYNANRIASGARYLGGAAMAYGAYADGKSLYGQYQISQQTGSYANTTAEGIRIAGGWAGAWAVGGAGAQFGAGFGTAFGPVGTVVGGIVGGVAGGIAGYAGGSYALPRVANDLRGF